MHQDWQSLAVEAGNKPKQKAQAEAEEQARNNWKIECGVFAAMDDVAGKSSQAKGEPSAKVKQSPDKNKQASQEQQNAAQFAKWIHLGILMEDCAERLPWLLCYLYHFSID